MPRIAILADVHGNLPALDAVVDDIARVGVDEVLVGGDLVGRGPAGSAVVRRIRALGWPSIKGNHEDYLLDFRAGRVPTDWLSTEEWSAARWMAAELGETEAAYAASLPFSLAPRTAPGLRLVHGSPRSANEGLGPWSTDAELAEHLARVEERLLVCGHTHRPMLRKLPGGAVVNVGSVGLPFNRDRRAQYALFEPGADGGFRVELRQVPYDLEAIFDLYDSSGFLAEGGATARLLRLELEHATPFLVPFLKWAEARAVSPEPARIGEFLAFFRADEPLRSFFGRLEALRSETHPP
jgi:predicted phosphodiesterase